MINLVEFLLDNGADVNILDSHGWSPLNFALSNYLDELKTPIALLLIKRGANINQLTRRGETTLHIAASGDHKIAELLLDQGVAVNQKENERGFTPLHTAVVSGDLEMIRLLVKRGADVNSLDKRMLTPLRCSLIMRLRNPNDVGKEIEVVTLLLEHGMHLNSCNAASTMTRPTSYTALQDAMIGQNSNIVELLLQEGAQLYCTHPGESHMSALELATRSQDNRMLELLLSYCPSNDLKQVMEVFQKIKGQKGLCIKPLLMKTWLRHLTRLNLKFNDIQLSEKQQEYYEDCKQEIDDMRSRIVCDKIRFYDLFTASTTALPWMLAANETLVTNFKASHYKYNYPIYKNYLTKTVNRVKKIYLHLIDAEKMLKILFRMELPHLISRQILGYFTRAKICDLSNMYEKIMNRKCDKAECS